MASIDSIYSISEFGFKLWNWKQPRRFVVVRELVQSKKPAVGRKLTDLPSYVFRVFVTNRPDAALEIWRDYNGRAAVESVWPLVPKHEKQQTSETNRQTGTVH